MLKPKWTALWIMERRSVKSFLMLIVIFAVSGLVTLCRGINHGGDAITGTVVDVPDEELQIVRQAIVRVDADRHVVVNVPTETRLWVGQTVVVERDPESAAWVLVSATALEN
jgi:preprotein translocase subunit SecF